MAVDAGLGEVHLQIEQARTWATNGEYPEARQTYEAVLLRIHRGLKGLEDASLRQRWAECVAALQQEKELVLACEEECLVLRRSASGPAGTSRAQDEVQQGSSGAAGGGRPIAPSPAGRVLGMEFDFSSGRATPLQPSRTWGAAAHTPVPEAAPPDPDRWPDPPPRERPAPGGRASPRWGRADRERARECEQRRRSSAPGAAGAPGRRGGASSFADVKPKVNTGATRAGAAAATAGARRADTKCQLLEQMLARFGSGEQELVEQLGRDLVDSSPGVTWADIAGLGEAKRVLKENVSMPLVMKSIFQGVLRPVKGVLLFGPPGTGKTLLAKAVATECGTAFFNVSASTLASKYRGEGEKLVRVLFEMARAAAPAVIFIDEVDALCSARGAASEHEASRRMKTELLTQIDGMHTAAGRGDGEPRRVMVLAATNYPWDIDEALRRRLEKRVYIPLPGQEDRVEMLALCLKGSRVAEEVSFEEIARLTEGFSGDDMANVCREAAFGVVRRHMAGRSLSNPAAMVALEEELRDNMVISMADFRAALARTNPSCSQADVARHEAFAAQHGAT